MHATAHNMQVACVLHAHHMQVACMLHAHNVQVACILHAHYMQVGAFSNLVVHYTVNSRVIIRSTQYEYGLKFRKSKSTQDSYVE